MKINSVIRSSFFYSLLYLNIGSSIEDKLVQKNWERYSIKTTNDNNINFESIVYIKFNKDYSGIRVEKYKKNKFERKSSFSWSLKVEDGDPLLLIQKYKLLEEKNTDSLKVFPPLEEPKFNENAKYIVKFLSNGEARLSSLGSLENPATIYYLK